MTVDVIIPVYKPERSFLQLIEKLETQTRQIRRIIIMNTEEKYFEQMIYGTRFLEQHQQVMVYHLSKKEFDHGRTRAKAVEKSDADIFVMMTQDAMPVDDRLIETLTTALGGRMWRQHMPDNCLLRMPHQWRHILEATIILQYPAKNRLRTCPKRE